MPFVKNNELRSNIFINPYKIIPFEFHMHMCFHVKCTWILSLQNDLWKTLWMYVKLKFMMYDANYYLYFLYNPQYTTRL